MLPGLGKTNGEENVFTGLSGAVSAGGNVNRDETDIVMFPPLEQCEMWSKSCN